MTDYLNLLSQSSPFKTVKGEKDAGRLSHAYLILCQDGDNLEEYLKVFAKLIACENGSPCNKCRACSLIEGKNHSDVIFYPKGDKAQIGVEEIAELIEESYFKPIESSKKVFVLAHAENMTVQAQNKLLKTLEEPPKGVHILLGATSEFPLLATIKSRVKKLEISSFDAKAIFNALKEDCLDHQRLNSAIACSDRTLGNAKKLYFDENLTSLIGFAADLLVNMKSSRDVLKYSTELVNAKFDFGEFLSVLELLLRDLLVMSQGKGDLCFNGEINKRLQEAENFNTGSILYSLECVVKASERKKFNANTGMLTEWLLFQILEGKYKWQKLSV